jgi:L-cysteate sulfo-lyase
MTIDLPRFPLIDGPSPLHRVPRLAEALGGRVDIWMKREDLLPLAFGGNKLRNLEFLIGAALAQGSDTLVTSGRRWSNHCRLTAAAGARAGLDVHLVLSGPHVEPPGPGILVARAYGATVHQLATADRTEREARVAAVVADLRAAGRRPYVVDVGGTGVVGATGQLMAAREAFDQAAAAAVRFDAIVVPTATGGTQAGLIVGASERSPATLATGVVVARPVSELAPVVERLAGELAGHVGIDLPGDVLQFDETQLGDGYGRPTAAANEATELLAKTEAILVDPIYTAKALAAVIATVRSGAIDGQTLLFWHAGGTLGLLEPLD